MFFDDINQIQKIDHSNVLDQIRRLPEQIYSGWHLGLSRDFPGIGKISKIVLIGMGESANSLDLVKVYIEKEISVPVFTFREFCLPKWVAGQDTLVIAVSHTGNTDETCKAMEEAIHRNCKVVALSKGGRLIDSAKNHKQNYVLYFHEGHRGFAIGYTFGLTLAVLQKLGLVEDQEVKLKQLMSALKSQIKVCDFNVTSPFNPAKRLAGQLIDRAVLIISAGFMEPVARRWKNQINTTAKAWAQYDMIPNLNHNTQESLYFGGKVMQQLMVVFLGSGIFCDENKKRIDLTKQSFMLAGVGTDQVNGRGDDVLSQIWTTLLFGDFVAYYLAIHYEVDPASIMGIEDFKLDVAN